MAFRAARPGSVDVGTVREGSRKNPGRFNTEAFAALYLSRDPQTAIGELQRTVQRKGRRLTDANPCALHVVQLKLHLVVDLTSARAMREWGIHPSDLTGDDLERCQDIAEEAVRAGAEAICWPSVAGSGQNLAVFVGRLRSISSVELADRIDLSPDVLQSLELGAHLRDLIELPDRRGPHSSAFARNQSQGTRAHPETA